MSQQQRRETSHNDPKPAEVCTTTGETFTVHHVCSKEAGWLVVIEEEGELPVYYAAHRIDHVNRLPTVEDAPQNTTEPPKSDADPTREVQRVNDLDRVQTVLNELLIRKHPEPQKVYVAHDAGEFYVGTNSYVEQFENHKSAIESLGFEYDGERNVMPEGEARNLASQNVEVLE